MSDKQCDLNAIFFAIKRFEILAEGMKDNINKSDVMGFNMDYYKKCKQEIKKAMEAHDRIDKALENC